jgi:PTH1 family peptidyl-tRNA hydrolase
LIVGLGNPGKKYERNRHNVGFMAIDRYAKSRGIPLDIKKKKAVYGKGNLDGSQIILLKPQTFMNLSGEAVLYLASFLKITTPDITVILDDTELPFGQIRIRKSGSSGGHNGVKSLINSLKSENFPRIRFGIGRPQPHAEKDLCDYVLDDFTDAEMDTLDSELGKVVDALDMIIRGSIGEAMNRYNRKVNPEQ